MPVAPRLTCLVLDHHPEGRVLLARTLMRKFPTALVRECDTLEAALSLLQRDPVDVIVSHRVIGYDGVATARQLRQANPSLPLVMVSGAHRAEEAREAGADAFVHFDAWLTIGSVVEKLLAGRAAPEGEPTGVPAG